MPSPTIEDPVSGERNEHVYPVIESAAHPESVLSGDPAFY
jgi:hypothetical protein